MTLSHGAKTTFTAMEKFTEYKGLDLAGVADEVLARWTEEDTFHKSITTREGHPTFVFYEGEEASHQGCRAPP